VEGIKNDLKGRSGKHSNARPRNLTESGRVELRLRPQDRAALSRAAALKRLDLTGYILGTVLPKAESEIAQAERLSLSERDSLRGLKLLENPPAPTARLLRAAKVGFRLP
jgi:uncharacterized protein (DUF1778 family)